MKSFFDYAFLDLSNLENDKNGMFEKINDSNIYKFYIFLNTFIIYQFFFYL